MTNSKIVQNFSGMPSPSHHQGNTKILELSDELQNLNLSQKKVKYLVNTIAYVDENKDQPDSSDEENDNYFGDKLEKFDINNPPFKIRKIKIRARVHKGIHDGIENCDTGNRGRRPQSSSRVKQKFLKNLQDSGFNKVDRDSKDNVLTVSMALNRMKSLSTRANNALYDELNSRSETFGLFWKCIWEDINSRKVEFATVKKFYKQLKKQDAVAAAEFLKNAESGVAVPYQHIRENAKNHELTKKLVSEIQKKCFQNVDIYLCLIDSDTLYFNHVFSEYLKMYNDSKIAPIIMTTHYQLPTDHPKFGDIYYIFNELDRNIVNCTAKYLPGGAYCSEPNFCVLIPKNAKTVPESFLGTSAPRPPYGSESPNLIKSILKTRKINSALLKDNIIHSNGNTIVTTIPPRFFFYKKSKTPISFSINFKKNGVPSTLDFKRFNEIHQSNTDSRTWTMNLFVNGTITFKEGVKYAYQKCLGIIINACNNGAPLDDLTTYLLYPEDIENIKKAVAERSNILNEFEKKCKNVCNERRLNDLLSEWEIAKGSIPAENLEFFSWTEILTLFEDEILGEDDFKQCCEHDIDDLLRIFSAKIIDGLKAEIFYFDDVLELKLYEISDEFYPLSTLMEVLQEDSKFSGYIRASTDPIDAVYEYGDDAKFVECMLNVYGDEIDIEEIKNMMSPIAKTHFNWALEETCYSRYSDYYEDPLIDDYDDDDD